MDSAKLKNTMRKIQKKKQEKMEETKRKRFLYM
jgi:hypothetical protein